MQTSFNNKQNKNSSSETALSSFVKSIIINVDKNIFACSLFIDFYKAFDCVNHHLFHPFLTSAVLFKKIGNMFYVWMESKAKQI